MRLQAPQASSSLNKEINRKYIDSLPTGCVCTHLGWLKNIVEMPSRHPVSTEMIWYNGNTGVISGACLPSSLTLYHHITLCDVNMSGEVNLHLPFSLSLPSLYVTPCLPIFKGWCECDSVGLQEDETRGEERKMREGDRDDERLWGE